MDKALLELVEGIVEELAHLGTPEERLRPLRERIWALKVVRMVQQVQQEHPRQPLWTRPLFWTVLALLLAIVGALLGLPVHRVFP